MGRIIPSFAPVEFPGFSAFRDSGVRIVAEIFTASGSAKSIRLRGVCQCRNTELANLPEDLVKGAGIVVVRKEYADGYMLSHPMSFQAMGDVIVLDDDVRREGGMVRFYFDIDLFEQAGATPTSGDYYISAIFGKYVSNVEHMQLSL